MSHEDKRLDAEGKVDELKGKAKAAWGDATGDVSDQVAGRAEQVVGKAKQAAGEVMDDVEDVVKGNDHD